MLYKSTDNTQLSTTELSLSHDFKLTLNERCVSLMADCSMY